MSQPSSRKINREVIVSLTVTVVLAISGYIYTHIANRISERNTAKITRVNDQLRYLYGPLYSFASVSDITWDELLKVHPDIKKIDCTYTNVKLNKMERKAYQTYMTEVIRPYQMSAENAILNYSDLIDEDEMPLLFRELAAHIADSKRLFSSWAKGDSTIFIPNKKYPVDFKPYIREKYQELKLRQMSLLGVRGNF